MKKRNKLLAALALAGALGLAYWYSNKEEVAKSQKSPVEVSESSLTKRSNKARKIVPRININQSSHEEKDEFRDYIDNLELVPPILYKTDEKCDEKELDEAKKEHEQLSTLLENWDDTIPRRGPGRWPVVDSLIQIDTKLANCLYNGGDERYKTTLAEMTPHLEKNKRFTGAGSLQHYLGNTKQAKEYFKKTSDGLEALIKLTPAEELAKLKDNYLGDKKYLEAGKIEWYQGDKEKARQIIEQSEEFKEALNKSKNFIEAGEYEEAIDNLWLSYKIPFFRKTMENLCSNKRECLDELKKYDTSENVPVMLF